ncbi:MAG: lipopolysaccharide biosynthesis protein [Promethearchaeota archaeon]
MTKISQNSAISNGEEGTLAKNTFYSFLNTYGEYIFSIITSFIIARLISKELWGFFLLAYSYIMILAVIMEFIPPGLSHALHYFIPKNIAENKYGKIKNIIKNALFLKVVVVIFTFFVFLLGYTYFPNLFSLSLRNHTHLLLILSPLILISGINSIQNSILRGFNKYNLIFNAILMQNLIKLAFFFYYFFFVDVVYVEDIVIINVLSAIPPFFLKLIGIIKLHVQIKSNTNDKISFFEFIIETSKYGAPLSLGVGLLAFWYELQVQLTGIIDNPSMVTGLTISRNYTSIASSSSQSLSFPLTNSFSRLAAKKEHEKIVQIYNLTFKYSLFILQLISGILIFLTDIFLILVYGDSYLIFSFLVKIYFFIIVFKALEALLGAVFNAFNKVKYSPILVLIFFSFNIPLFLIGLISFGIIGGVIGLIISAIIELLMQIYLSYKIGKIKINNKKKVIFQYLTFFVAIFISATINQVLSPSFNGFIKNYPNLTFLESFEIVSLISFILIFILLNLLSNIFTIEDVEYLQGLFQDNKLSHCVIRKLLNLMIIFRKNK